MSSSFTVNNGLEKPAAGDQEGAWGGTLNTNFDIIDRVLSGVGSVALSGTTHTLTTSDGSLSGKNKFSYPPSTSNMPIV